MTATVATPILPRNPPSPDQPGSERHATPTTGDFAKLIHQAVVKPQPQARSAAGRACRVANPAAKDGEQDSEETTKSSAPKKAKDSAQPQIAPWPAGFPALASSQPLVVTIQATDCSGSEQTPSDSADVGSSPLSPAVSPGEKEEGSPCIDDTQSPGGPVQIGRSDLGFAYVPSL